MFKKVETFIFILFLLASTMSFAQSEDGQSEINPPTISCGSGLIEPLPLFGGCENRGSSDKKINEFIGSELGKYKLNTNDGGTRVYVRFWVEVDGSVQVVEIAKSSENDAVDCIALEIVYKMQDWKFPENFGTPRRVVFVLPIQFELD